MAFDAGMLLCVLHEIDGKLTNGKIEKIHMPQKDAVVLVMKNGRDTFRLYLNAGPASPRICITGEKAENPAVPPMFCMMLRKHLNGAKLIRTEQMGFERVARFSFETYDEMGFKTTKHLIAEIIGKFSNLILADENEKMIGILHPVDFTTSQKRQLLPGMKYEVPPKQDKYNPLQVTKEEFNRHFANADLTQRADKALLSSFAGMSSLTAGEIAYRAGGSADASLDKCANLLWQEFSSYVNILNSHTAVPYLLTTPEGEPKEYSYMEVRQYGQTMCCTKAESFSQLIDSYFHERNRQETLRQRAADILRLLTTAESRVARKIAIQKQELEDCAEGDRYKLYGDLITANIYRLTRGIAKADLENYYEDGSLVTIPMDISLTPSQNAQRYYKKYNKSKSARIHLTEQMAAAQDELQYIQSVLESLTRAENEKELGEIRDELYHSGYASKMKNYTLKKQSSPSITRFKTDTGRMIYCGKNNTANEYLTTKQAERSDWWFHVKNQPGSHVVMQCSGPDDEPTEQEFTQAAMIAAYYSKASDGVMVPVDYTLVRHVKKPAGSKPGFVIYTTNWTAYVTPDKNEVERLKI